MSEHLAQKPEIDADINQPAQARAAAAGNMMLPLSHEQDEVKTKASSPEMPITMPWYSVNELTLSL